MSKETQEELNLIVEDIWQNFEQYTKEDIAEMVNEAYLIGKGE